MLLADLSTQNLINRLSVLVLLWNPDDVNAVYKSSGSLIHFLSSYRSDMPFAVRSMVSPSITAVRPRVAKFRMPCLAGRFFLQEFTSSTYILHVDADIWMMKPWLGPLVEEISLANQSSKLIWGGLDWGFLLEKERGQLARLKVPRETYINAGFFLIRNIPETRTLMNQSVEYWITHPETFWQDQTVMNIIFDDRFKGKLSERFSKWNFRICKTFTINCHGYLPLIERSYMSKLEAAHNAWSKETRN
jgi:hypothetical protein